MGEPTYLSQVAKQVRRSPCFVHDRLKEAPPEVQADITDHGGLRVLGPKAIAYVVAESNIRPRRGSGRKTVPAA